MPHRPFPSLTSAEEGRMTMYIDRNISSNAEALVALLLVCALAVVAFV